MHISEVLPSVLAMIERRSVASVTERFDRTLRECGALADLGELVIEYERAKCAHDCEPTNDALGDERSAAHKALRDAIDVYLKRTGGK